MKAAITFVMVLVFPTIARADETFVKIHRVNGNQIAVVKDDAGTGRGMRGGGAVGSGVPANGLPANGAPMQGQRGQSRRGLGQRGQARGSGATTTQPTVITVNRDVKITSAMRERRTFEFRVGAELAGGLKHRVFQDLQAPLAARVVTEGNRITQINVIIPETDINQSSATVSGQAVIAVRPKRPPTKRLSKSEQ